MNVLQVTKWFIPYRGGIETVVEQLAQGLLREGIDAKVLTCHHSPAMRDNRESIGSIPVTRCQSFGNYFGTPVSLSYPFHYRQLASSSDLLHFHAPFPVGELAFPLADLSDKNVVVTFHADPGDTRWKMLEKIYRPIIRNVLERADRIAVTSPQMRDQSDALEGLRDKCRVIPLAANVEVADPGQDEIQRLKKQKGLDGRPVLLGVGRMVYYKGFKYAIEAMRSVDAELVLVGQGEDRKALQEKAKEWGVEDRVHLPGYVSSEELSEYYALADLFVFPSVTPAEAFGIVQVEAMAHGLPVINTQLPTGVPFVSKDEETGLTVEPRDAAALAAAINRLLQDDALRHKLSKSAEERATSFSGQAMVDRYLEMYEEVQ